MIDSEAVSVCRFVRTVGCVRIGLYVAGCTPEVAMPKNYWMSITSFENFEITRKLNFTVQGVKAQQQRKIQRIEPGDRLLFYIRDRRYFAATATVKSQYYEDRSPLWKKEGVSDWAFRIRIQPEIVLDEEKFMDALQLAPRLDYVRKWAPEDWSMAFAQTNLHLLPKKDFLLIEEEMRKTKLGSSYEFPPREAAPRPRHRTRSPNGAPHRVPNRGPSSAPGSMPNRGPSSAPGSMPDSAPSSVPDSAPDSAQVRSA